MNDREINDTHLIIGDVQGQDVLLKNLFIKEGLMGEAGERLKPEVTVIQLGDLGHFARYNMGSQRIEPENDKACFDLLENGIIDLMLWGNHDRPIMGHLNMNQIFGGYRAPDLEEIYRIQNLRAQGRIKLAHVAEGFLLTHAGLHSSWAWSGINDVEEIANQLNAYDDLLFDGASIMFDDMVPKFIDTIGHSRGGDNSYGGILWRDNEDEDLYDGVRQIYGHSSYSNIQAQPSRYGDSYCLDVSKADRIGAIWLSSETVVTVGETDLISNDKDDTDHS